MNAQIGTLLPEYNSTAAGEIMDRLESIVAPTSDSDSTDDSSEDEEDNSSELDERALFAAFDRSREQVENDPFAAIAKSPSETKRRERVRRKRKIQAAKRTQDKKMEKGKDAEHQAAISARVQIALDDNFYDGDDVLKSVEEAEREKAERESKRKRRKPSGAAAVMFDSDEEDFTSSFNFALRF